MKNIDKKRCWIDKKILKNNTFVALYTSKEPYAAFF
jgi:hypothetical protein